MSMTRNRNYSLDERIARAIEDCLEIAEEKGRLTEDDAAWVARDWTTDDLDNPDAEYYDDEPHPDLEAIDRALTERFGF